MKYDNFLSRASQIFAIKNSGTTTAIDRRGICHQVYALLVLSFGNIKRITMKYFIISCEAELINILNS